MPNAFTTMRKHILTILILTTLTSFSTGQNLVPNSSFEIHTSCPTGSSQISLAFPWQGVTTNSSDYYNACAVAASGCNVPNTGGGVLQYARTGVAYAGIWVINSYGGNYREYLRVKLDSTLQVDSCYYVEFYCNLNNASFYSINKMGAYLSSTAASIVGPGTWGLVLQYTPQVVSTTFLSDTLNWMRVSGYYQANGGEKYITIGSFTEENPSDTLQMSAGTYPGAYYFIDDVSVIKVPSCDTVGVGIMEIAGIPSFKLYPNPTNQSTTLEFSNPTQNCILTLYDLRGQVVRTIKNITSDKVVIERQSLTSGLYFFQLGTDRQTIATGKLTIE
jgi:hypothetical protein